MIKLAPLVLALSVGYCGLPAMAQQLPCPPPGYAAPEGCPGYVEPPPPPPVYYPEPRTSYPPFWPWDYLSPRVYRR